MHLSKGERPLPIYLSNAIVVEQVEGTRLESERVLCIP